MLKEYKVVTLNHLISGDVPQAYRNDRAITRALERVSYRPLLRNWRQQRSADLFLLDDEYNKKLEDSYWGMAEQAHAIAPCGELRFEHIWCLGRDALRVDIENGVVFTGQCINWGEDYFKWWIENSGIGFLRWITPTSFLADFGEPNLSDDNIVMMKSPGYGIFGHWLLDFFPQLALHNYMEIDDSTKFVFDHLTDWMQLLLQAAGIRNYACYQHQLTEHRNMRMPTGLKNGYALGQPINGIAWHNLRGYFNHLNREREPAQEERLYLSRRNWGGQRGFSNYDAVEIMMKSHGFSVYYPEQFSLEEQAHTISNARVVIGEDGSALHSLLFAHPGAILGVLMLPDRLNLWHAGICDTMGHRIAYHQIHDRALGKPDIANIEAFVVDLLART